VTAIEGVTNSDDAQTEPFDFALAQEQNEWTHNGRRRLTWHAACIALRNCIGQMDYDDFGAIGYLATAPWRRRLADVFDAAAYRLSPTALIRRLGVALRLVEIGPNDECPF
jgi:hypothetical protein